MGLPSAILNPFKVLPHLILQQPYKIELLTQKFWRGRQSCLSPIKESGRTRGRLLIQEYFSQRPGINHHFITLVLITSFRTGFREKQVR